ncbi:MAG: hypothetical protein OXQ29_01215 [Rhodospirillaceae bacterium]|nr:hypothetical protein [Rhodospirillaceae bacterium]
MESFEQAFAETEDAADAAVGAATGLGKLTRQLQKAAREGNISAIRRTQERLETELKTLGQAVDNAVRAWPLEEDDEERHFKDGYLDELRRAASERGLTVHERDGRLIVHPSIVQVLARERAVRIDRKKVSAIRPSHLAGLLHAAQSKKSRHRPERFLESLHVVYSELVREEFPGNALRGGSGPVVQLERIYKLLTSLPGSARDYTRTDFARDLYLLDTSGLTRTRKGAAVSFPASTGTRTRGARLFTFVGPKGEDVQYYGIRFTEPV